MTVYEHPEDSALGIAERGIKNSRQTPEQRAANVASARRMATVGGSTSVAADLLRWHSAKLEAGE